MSRSEPRLLLDLFLMDRFALNAYVVEVFPDMGAPTQDRSDQR
jgi:hypothetical protein